MIRIIPVNANVIIVVHTYYTYTASFDVLTCCSGVHVCTASSDVCTASSDVCKASSDVCTGSRLVVCIHVAGQKHWTKNLPSHSKL